MDIFAKQHNASSHTQYCTSDTCLKQAAGTVRQTCPTMTGSMIESQHNALQHRSEAHPTHLSLAQTGVIAWDALVLGLGLETATCCCVALLGMCLAD
jgi:hypothetical protein